METARSEIGAHGSDPAAEREKRLVALTSVIAAVFLTGMKTVVGILTNSLGILSEAAHSALDLVAALVTLFAVRVSDRPPDREHPYGHGKVENLSALVETLLLLATCGWIVYEAVHRLFEPVEVDASVWSFVVMITSILVDLGRSRALLRVAKKHNSQALEADALHFSTDVWSSSVVILGLAAVWLGDWLRETRGIDASWLFKADALAALGVSAIVVWVSWRLGRRTMDVLLDRTSREMTARIEEAVARIPGISGVRRVRLRHSGPAHFVDMTLDIPRIASLEEAHLLATEAERTVQGLYPRTDVMVHIDPVVRNEHSLVEVVLSAAARHGLGIHGLRIYDVRGRQRMVMHVEVRDTMTLGQAHDQVSAFEADLRSSLQGLDEVVTHLEPLGDAEVRRSAEAAAAEGVRRAVVELPRSVPGVQDCHHIEILRDGAELSVTFHCLVDSSVPIREAHRLSMELEARLRSRIQGLGRVVIHVEPPEKRDE